MTSYVAPSWACYETLDWQAWLLYAARMNSMNVTLRLDGLGTFCFESYTGHYSLQCGGPENGYIPMGKTEMTKLLHALGMDSERLLAAMDGDAYDGVTLPMDRAEAQEFLAGIQKLL